MKTLRSIVFSVLAVIIISACENNQNSESLEMKSESLEKSVTTCPYIKTEVAEKWHSELTEEPYKIYQNFDDIPFRISLIDSVRKEPTNKHIMIFMGYSENTEQSYYLFTVIGNGTEIGNLELEYTSLAYYSTSLNEWVSTDKAFFDEAKSGWKIKIEESQLLPTISFTAPTIDYLECPYEKFGYLLFGIDTEAELDYKLRILFHEKAMNKTTNDDEYFDTLTPCPPFC